MKARKINENPTILEISGAMYPTRLPIIGFVRVSQSWGTFQRVPLTVTQAIYYKPAEVKHSGFWRLYARAFGKMACILGPKPRILELLKCA